MSTLINRLNLLGGGPVVTQEQAMARGSGTGWLGGGLGSTVINPTFLLWFLFLCGFEPRQRFPQGSPIHYGGPSQFDGVLSLGHGGV